MTFARISSVAGEPNVKYIWHKIEKDKSMGVVFVVATRAIRPFEEIIVPCEQSAEDDPFRTPVNHFVTDFQLEQDEPKLNVQ